MADSDPSSSLRFPDWQREYEAALMETDSDKLQKFVRAAELAILGRLQALVGKADHGEERIAMTDALHALRYLKGSIAL
jgi:predicted aspartyl protease